MLTIEDLAEYLDDESQSIQHLNLFVLSTSEDFVWHIIHVGSSVDGYTELYVTDNNERRHIYRRGSTEILVEIVQTKE